LTFIDGFPGPLKKTLGIWCEEIDALYPGETNSIEWDGRTYQAFDLCELVHREGRRFLGSMAVIFMPEVPR
jgi:beta-galactosidase